MRPIIEFCSSNMHHGTDQLMKRLEANPDYDVIEYGCLGNCGECFLLPYALVNGEIVAGSNVEELEQRIAQKIKEIEDMLDLFE
ncbi:YuzB family protein [Paenibacillus rigui]|uniref:UDP-N-acetylmuramoylalanine--D-glutamate ligase n=1 Tax=Paenibacillus rigui TaxID=554312 RepID=A0A229UUZ2_9BACL|nr:YuzB family protein [Paenibacillus rigui]OXM87190.1 UDP-N-acetylmuramoylalanine--D-glutamate ligase [Paenibacillus rigui]